MKPRTGYVYQNKSTGTWYARITYTDRSGKRKNIQRKVENKSKGSELLKKLVHTLDTEGTAAIEAEKLTLSKSFANTSDSRN